MNGARVMRSQRRGAVAIFVMVSLVLFMGFAAISIDLGRYYLARTELQRAADLAALASVSAYFTDTGLSQEYDQIRDIAYSRGAEVASRNLSLNAAVILAEEDLALGTHYWEYPWTDLDTTGIDPFNAAEVELSYGPDSPNGSVPFWFAAAFGTFNGGTTVRARAAILDRFSGLSLEELNFPDLIPFTMHVDQYEQQFASGDDNYSYDRLDECVSSASDGVREVILFPEKAKTKKPDKGGDESESDGAGNFGCLSIGAFSVPELRPQIEGGISLDDLRSFFGADEITYADESGNPITYATPGRPGLVRHWNLRLRAASGMWSGSSCTTVFLKRGPTPCSGTWACDSDA